MSFADRLLGGIKDLLVMREQVARLETSVDRLIANDADHEGRLIRIETMIEMNERAAQRRLPRK